MKILIFAIFLLLSCAFANHQPSFGELRRRTPGQSLYNGQVPVHRTQHPGSNNAASFQRGANRAFMSMQQKGSFASKEDQLLYHERKLREVHPYRHFSSVTPTVSVVNSMNQGPIHPRMAHQRLPGSGRIHEAINKAWLKQNQPQTEDQAKQETTCVSSSEGDATGSSCI